jgi:hypothetical protein
MYPQVVICDTCVKGFKRGERSTAGTAAAAEAYVRI